MRLGAQPFLWKWVLFEWEWKMISKSKAEHLPSFWNRGQGELGNGLLKEAEIKCVHFSLLPKNVFSTEICSNFSKSSYSEQPHCERLVRFSASGIHQQNNYELKAEKRPGPQAAQTKGVSITRTKLDESSNPRIKRLYKEKTFAPRVFHSVSVLSPPQRLPLGIPIKISIIEKNRKRAGDDGKRETACPARSLFLSPQPQHKSLPTIQRGLCGGERSQSELSQNDTKKKTQSTNRKARLEPAIKDAQTIAQNVFPPRRPTLTSRSLQSICAATFSWILWKCSDLDLLSFYKGLGRKIFTQISFRMVLFSVWWR